MSRIRIMHVVDSFGTGGTEEGIRKLLSGLDPAVFEQVVCTVAAAPEIEAKSGARVVSLGRSGTGQQVLVGKLKRLFDRERPDIVHSRNWGAIEAVVAARVSRVRTVIHSEHGLESSTYRRQPWRRNAIRRLCFTWADRVFAVSQALRAYYALHLRIRETRMSVIPNGVDSERFRRQDDLRHITREKLGAGPDTLVVGTVGRLDPVKDHRTLFAAMDLLLASGIPVRLVVVGDGPERPALEMDIKTRSSLAEQTVFTGNTTHVVSQLNSFDVFVLPSLAEGMSNALLEAMSVGLPCIATRVGGNPELIEEGLSGLLFNAGDARTLAAHLKTLASDPERRRNLAGNARKRIEVNFSLHRMLNNYTHLYENALANRRADSGLLNYLPSAQRLSE
jgi:sugar transferase (PEP-CTERM/EpsH1 system associated)